ncbi:MAG: HAMP domain-containing histidine kinase [Natronospirillum sp.]
MAEQFHPMLNALIDGWWLFLIAVGVGAVGYDLVRRWWYVPRERARVQAKHRGLEHRGLEHQGLEDELAHLKKRLVRQEHMATLGKLASGVAHEISNPAGYVTSNLKTLKRYIGLLLAREAGTLSEPDRQELLFVQADLPTLMDDCLDGVNRISGIVRSLRSYTRGVDSVEHALNTWEVLVSNAVRLTHGEIHHQCRLEKELNATRPVLVNERELTQVLANLILNARDAIALSGQGSRIVLRTQDTDGGSELVVEDDGPGVPSHAVERIFEPFFTTKANDKGTGLGLSICREIIELKHGGTIRYEPASHGGARFVIHLPVADDEDRSEQ